MHRYRAALLTALLLASLSLMVACGDDEDPVPANNSAANNNPANNNPANNNPANNNPVNNAVNNNPVNNNPVNNNPVNNNPVNNNPVDPTVSQCGGFTPGIFVPVEREEACAACVDEACCDEAAACGDDAACLAARQCYAACADFDDACTAACGEQHPASDEALNTDFVSCRNASCAAECRRGGNWLCLDAPVVVEGFTEATRTFRVRVDDFQTGMPVVGALLRACANEDTACETPLAEGTTDAEGFVEITVPVEATGFAGYYEITEAERYPALFVENPPLQGEEVSFRTLSQNTFNAFTALVGVTPDPTRGHAALQGEECDGRGGPELTFASSNGDASTRAAYIAGSLPSAAATETDLSGVGGLFNVPAGANVTISGTLRDGRLVGAVEVPIRAGWITITNIVPTFVVE
jgi:hypothetical protein